MPHARYTRLRAALCRGIDGSANAGWSAHGGKLKQWFQSSKRPSLVLSPNMDSSNWQRARTLKLSRIPAPVFDQPGTVHLGSRGGARSGWWCRASSLTVDPQGTRKRNAVCDSGLQCDLDVVRCQVGIVQVLQPPRHVPLFIGGVFPIGPQTSPSFHRRAQGAILPLCLRNRDHCPHVRFSSPDHTSCNRGIRLFLDKPRMNWSDWWLWPMVSYRARFLNLKFAAVNLLRARPLRGR